MELKDARILFVIVPRFKDVEYQKSRGVFERRGMKIMCAGKVVKDAFGMEGAKAKVELLLDQVEVDDFDALLMLGGLGMKDLWNDEQLFALIRSAAEAGKVLGAIDIGPVLLAKAGVLNGKKATVYFSETKALTAAGAEYLTRGVVEDGTIVTGKGPDITEEWAVAIIRALQKL